VIYYGDEIGMGENIYLGDRNGVRTPMQWSADRNAGFSRASTQSLYLPINLDPENHYEAVNVDVQQRSPHSLLWWMKRLIALRKRWSAFGLGTLEFLEPENRKILAFVRQYEGQCLLTVANLSRYVQPVEMDMSKFAGRVPVELFGRTEFPAIASQPYFLTLSPHGFYWFSLEQKRPGGIDLNGQACIVDGVVGLEVEEDWEEIFGDKCRPDLEQALSCYLPTRRWFGGKAKVVKGVYVQECIPMTFSGGKAFITLLRADYVQNESETYSMPLAFAMGEEAIALRRDRPALVIATIKQSNSDAEGVLFDAIGNADFCKAILDLMMSRRTLKGNEGELEANHTALTRQMNEAGLPPLEPSLCRAEQSNSSVIFGDCLILKFFRKIDMGVNPDFDIPRFLSARKFPNITGQVSALQYHNDKEEVMSLAILSRYVPQCKDGWEFTLDMLSRYFDRVQALPAESRLASSMTGSLVKRAAGDMPTTAMDMIGTYIASARLLGEITAQMHLALSSDSEDKDFAPEPFTPHYVRGLFQSMRNLTRQNFQLLNKRVKNLPESVIPEAQRVLGLEAEILKCFSAVYRHPISAMRIRHHGDFHLGQVLHTGKDFLIIDFEGEPARSLSERRLKRSPLRDVAGMIRSFHYVVHAGLIKQMELGTLAQQNVPAATSWGQYWQGWVSTVFFKAYRQTVGAASFLPQNDAELQVLIDAFLLEKAIYELGYELNNRPDWIKIPLLGILELMDTQKQR
jgi:maltose alpha-D-glucosyltransferase/alpha-amylase